MGARGPAPQPTNVRVFRGNPGRRPMPSKEPRPPVEAPGAPAALDREALREWRRVVPLLIAVKCITKLDRTLLAMYCAEYSRWYKAEKAITKHGLTFEGEFGPKVRPEVKIAQEAARIVSAIGGKLGLSPSDRGRIEVLDTGTHEDPAKAILGY